MSGNALYKFSLLFILSSLLLLSYLQDGPHRQAMVVLHSVDQQIGTAPFGTKRPNALHRVGPLGTRGREGLCQLTV